MLKQLFNRLHLFLTGILMTIITLILCFSLWNMYQSRQLADISFIQRMTSLIIYQLEGDPADPAAVLSSYEEGTNVYSILENSKGEVLYESIPEEPEDFSSLLDTITGTISAENTSEGQSFSSVTEQGGYVEIEWEDHSRYYGIPAAVSTKSGNQYTLALFYKRTSPGELLLREGPKYLTIWLLSLICILLVSRLLLRRAFAPTEQILLSQKNFVASASHELKSPLAVILANVETIQSAEPEEAQVQTCLKTIDSECTRMSKLVRDMLLLASSDADQWTIQKSKVNVDTLLITLYEAYEPLCARRAIRLKLSVSEDSYPVLSTDRERLFQILSIYLDNAVCYSPKNSVIEIRTGQTAKELTFYIVDHGCGVAEKDKAFIFDRFYCADPARTDKSHFGLGLSIAKELSRALDGKIGFLDTEGGGATFFLTLGLK